MTIKPGSRLGPYEIVSPLGAGGMGRGLPRRGPAARARRGRQGAAGVVLERFGSWAPTEWLHYDSILEP